MLSTAVDGEDCRYCSVVSKAVGEDPIGTAIAADQWVFIEVSRPWTKALWQDQSHLSSLLPLFDQIQRRPRLWLQLRIGAIAPDADYSRPGYTHVLYYQRPSRSFAQFDALAYCVPTEQVTSLVKALVLEPKQLAPFNPYLQPSPTRDIFVCTHTHYDVACGRFGTPLYKQLRKEYGGAGEQERQKAEGSRALPVRSRQKAEGEVKGSRFQVPGSGFQVSGTGSQNSGSRTQPQSETLPPTPYPLHPTPTLQDPLPIPPSPHPPSYSPTHSPSYPPTHPPSLPPLRVWQTSHFGGHNFAPTLVDFPSGHFWGHLESDVLDALVYQRGDVTRLRPYYRGWAGCDRWAQIAERDIWMQEGWPWLGYTKTAWVVAKDSGRWFHRWLRWGLRWIPTIRAQVLLKKLEQKLTWAQVRIRYSSPDGVRSSTYEARVEVSHIVMSQMKSGREQPTYPVKQYRVTNLRKLEDSTDNWRVF